MISNGSEQYVAKYKCLKCYHVWEGNPGPVTCPKCTHEYVKWINYEDLKKLGMGRQDAG